MIEITAVHVVSAGAICPRTAKDEKLLLLLIVADGSGPASFGAPASLCNGAPRLRLDVKEHDVIQARASYIVVQLVLHTGATLALLRLGIGERAVILSTIN